MFGAQPSPHNHSSSTTRLVELSTAVQSMELATGEDGCCSTISSQPFLLYNQVIRAEYSSAEHGTDHWRGWLLLNHLLTIIPPLQPG
jgi:hypothetical protein